MTSASLDALYRALPRGEAVIAHAGKLPDEPQNGMLEYDAFSLVTGVALDMRAELRETSGDRDEGRGRAASNRRYVEAGPRCRMAQQNRVVRNSSGHRSGEDESTFRF